MCNYYTKIYFTKYSIVIKPIFFVILNRFYDKLVIFNRLTGLKTIKIIRILTSVPVLKPVQKLLSIYSEIN
jgi:hypothetical protein